jgi:hypothetical protein
VFSQFAGWPFHSLMSSRMQKNQATSPDLEILAPGVTGLAPRFRVAWVHT